MLLSSGFELQSHTSTTGVQERPQPFETFGGPRAGGLAAVATGAGRDVVVGAWDDGGPGLDGAVWLRSAGRWDRLPGGGTALASTSTDLVQVASVGLTGTSGDPPTVVVAGAATDLSGSAPSQRPVAWTSRDPRGPWQRHDLPATTSAARVTGSTCDRTGCWLGGTDGDVAALWRLTARSAPSPEGPDVADPDVVVDRVPLPGTVATTSATGALTALDGATLWVVVRGHSMAALVRRDGAGTWSVWAATCRRGPPGAGTSPATSGPQAGRAGCSSPPCAELSARGRARRASTAGSTARASTPSPRRPGH